jgi:penicillin-binding protein 2
LSSAAGIVRNEDRPWKHRDHALFVGYAPAAAPRYAVAVVVEHGGGGSKAAAPIARDVLLEAQRLNPASARAAPLPAAEFIPPNPANRPAVIDEEND